MIGVFRGAGACIIAFGANGVVGFLFAILLCSGFWSAFLCYDKVDLFFVLGSPVIELAKNIW